MTAADKNEIPGHLSMLTEALKKAAASSLLRRDETAEDGVASQSYVLSSDEFCKSFMDMWLYSENKVNPLNAAPTSGSYIALLHKNLSVTNASLLEFRALLSLHTKRVESDRNLSVQFFSSLQFKRFFQLYWEATWRPISDTSKTGEALIEKVDKSIDLFIASVGDALNETIVADIYFTTIVFHVPKSLLINLVSMVAESGYIHSIGLALYLRNASKATENELLDRISNYFNDRPEQHKVFLTPYADEFFKPYESDHPVSIRNGLDSVRLNLKKHAIGDRALVTFLAELPSKFPGKIVVPKGFSDFAVERRESVSDGCSELETLWFISDRAAKADGRQITPETDQYLFVYVQIYLNQSPLVLFKERRPAWYASVTLPHTLSAACINIVRANRQISSLRGASDARQSKKVVVLEPFCGSGTSLIDYSLRDPDAVVIGLDRNSSVDRIVSDNIEIFCASSQQLDDFTSQIKHSEWAGIFNKELNNKAIGSEEHDFVSRVSRNEMSGSLLLFAATLVADEIKREKALNENFSFGPELITSMVERGFSKKTQELLNDGSVTLFHRIAFYAAWRTVALGSFNLRGNFDDLSKLLDREFKGELTQEYKYLTSVCRQANINAPEGQPDAENTDISVSVGLYSKTLRWSRSAFARLKTNLNTYDEATFPWARPLSNLAPGVHVVRVADSIEAMRKLPARAIDVIFTDPPYSFNTAEGGLAEVQKLYSQIVHQSVRTLSSFGQFFAVLPAYARNGRQIPYFETQGPMVRQVLACAAAENRDVVSIARTAPGASDLFLFPAYWRSATTLERRLVNFQLS